MFAIAVAVNYVWEFAQSPLYVGQGLRAAARRRSARASHTSARDTSDPPGLTGTCSRTELTSGCCWPASVSGSRIKWLAVHVAAFARPMPSCRGWNRLGAGAVHAPVAAVDFPLGKSGGGVASRAETE